MTRKDYFCLIRWRFKFYSYFYTSSFNDNFYRKSLFSHETIEIVNLSVRRFSYLWKIQWRKERLNFHQWIFDRCFRRNSFLSTLKKKKKKKTKNLDEKLALLFLFLSRLHYSSLSFEKKNKPILPSNDNRFIEKGK